MKIAVVGLGLMGGSLALDLSGLGVHVTGVERNERNAARALELKLVQSISTLDDAASSADLVALAVPVDAIEKLLPHVLSLVREDAVVIDLGSTKANVCAVADAHPRRGRYVAWHPMAGTENSGPDAALRGLFIGKASVICDAEKSAPDALARVEQMVAHLRMRPIRMSARNHDLHAAFVSHLSHVSSFVLANTVLAKEKDAGTIFDLAGGGFESTVRLAKSSPDMWAPIFDKNRDNLREALDSYLEHLQAFRRSLDEPSLSRTRSLMEDANRIRRVLQDMGKR